MGDAPRRALFSRTDRVSPRAVAGRPSPFVSARWVFPLWGRSPRLHRRGLCLDERNVDPGDHRAAPAIAVSARTSRGAVCADGTGQQVRHAYDLSEAKWGLERIKRNFDTTSTRMIVSSSTCPSSGTGKVEDSMDHSQSRPLEGRAAAGPAVR